MRTTAAEAKYETETAKWAAVQQRDANADGHFYFSVKTTGVYCRPSCAARPPRRENVAFHATKAAAEQAGFRPCLRCKPDQPPKAEREAVLVTAACRLLETAEETPQLHEVAKQAGLSPHYFHRLFKRIVGVSPKAYAAAHRQNRVRDELAAGSNVTDAIYSSGFNSSARFYESAPGTLGMKPSAYRLGGTGETVWHAIGRCSLGHALVAATERGLCAILLGDDPVALRKDLAARFANAKLEEAKPEFASWVEKVVDFVDDPTRREGLGLPLDVRGTAFQRRVWEVLRGIPAGKTASYSEVAKRVGNAKAARAVAAACGANNLAVAIPCHRVIAASGDMSGYHWGVERKRRLLEREGSR